MAGLLSLSLAVRNFRQDAPERVFAVKPICRPSVRCNLVRVGVYVCCSRELDELDTSRVEERMCTRGARE